MIDFRTLSSASSGATLLLLLGLGSGLGGCANMSDTLMSAFADPAKYDMYDCKQLQDTRKSLAIRAAELQGLMAKAETGTAGSLVSEVAYRNDYISTRASARLADQIWQRNNCIAVPEKAGAASSTVAEPAAPVVPLGDPRGTSSLIR